MEQQDQEFLDRLLDGMCATYGFTRRDVANRERIERMRLLNARITGNLNAIGATVAKAMEALDALPPIMRSVVDDHKMVRRAGGGNATETGRRVASGQTTEG
jgi:hypothetical protein